MANLCSPYTVK